MNYISIKLFLKKEKASVFLFFFHSGKSIKIEYEFLLIMNIETDFLLKGGRRRQIVLGPQDQRNNTGEVPGLSFATYPAWN